LEKKDFVDDFKYLGLILDKDLTFNHHIKRLKGRISRVAGLFRRLKDILSFPVKRLLFFAFFQSQVSYGISVWGRTYRYLINGIQRVQNRAIKNLFGFPFLEATYDVHKRCAIFPIALLHFQRSTSLFHLYMGIFFLFFHIKCTKFSLSN
jgi:hypothetical protein